MPEPPEYHPPLHDILIYGKESFLGLEGMFFWRVAPKGRPLEEGGGEDFMVPHGLCFGPFGVLCPCGFGQQGRRAGCTPLLGCVLPWGARGGGFPITSWESIWAMLVKQMSNLLDHCRFAPFSKDGLSWSRVTILGH